MIDRIINTKKIEEADTIILSAPYEHGVSFMGGTSKGPRKIIECLDHNLELFDRDFLCEPAKILKTAHKEITGLGNLSSKKAVDKITAEYGKVFGKNELVMLLGGEHTISLGAFQAIAKKENPKDVTILQIDAHQDLRDDSSDYSENKNKYAHSCVMRRAHELGFNLVQVGIRTFSKYEYEYWQKNKDTITVFEWNEKLPQIYKISEILKAVNTKKVYLSIDVDGFDPAHMPGTGTPVQGGLGWHYGLNLIERLLVEKEVIAADIVEVSPQKDSVVTEWGVAFIAYKIMAWKFKNKLG